MARVSMEFAAPPDRVWETLADGWSYSAWVVGTVKIRAVDARWPAAGSQLHHAFGAWPLMIKDQTEVLECVDGTRLLLQARGWPMGEATVELTLHPAGDRTVVEMYEEPTAGPGAWVHNPVLDAVGRKRLDETLSRLRSLVEGRAGLGQRAGTDAPGQER
ncbi:MAG TPA: SRPBCC family protein [Actinomycetes bacterium]